MPRTQSIYTRVKQKASEKCGTHVAINSWDAAIRKAQRKIADLRQSIRVFEESKRNGEPWPVNEKAEKADALSAITRNTETLTAV